MTRFEKTVAGVEPGSMLDREFPDVLSFGRWLTRRWGARYPCLWRVSNGWLAYRSCRNRGGAGFRCAVSAAAAGARQRGRQIATHSKIVRDRATEIHVD
jgi:hypothetical protein